MESRTLGKFIHIVNITFLSQLLLLQPAYCLVIPSVIHSAISQ